MASFKFIKCEFLSIQFSGKKSSKGVMIIVEDWKDLEERFLGL